MPVERIASGGPRPAPAPRAVGLDNVRRNNLSNVLRLVHTHGSISRAQLTRELGLNRSTIAALVTELGERGLVIESAPEASNQVGRPSLVIAPDPSVAVIAINPELDALTIALVGLGGRVLNRVRYDHVGVPTAHEVINFLGGTINEAAELLRDALSLAASEAAEVLGAAYGVGADAVKSAMSIAGYTAQEIASVASTVWDGINTFVGYLDPTNW